MTTKNTYNYTNETLCKYVEATKAVLDSQLKSLNPTIRTLRLRKQIEYALQSRGKLLRATMLLLSGESVGGNRKRLEKLALAIEMLHAASLVHDDILDREIFRRNALSVQARWSVKEAVLVGDALASLALGICRGYGNEILDAMASACLQLSDGEYMDVSMSQFASSEKEYFEKAKKKTGALFRAAAKCGAIAAKGERSKVEALANFGENYGVAFQIRDDMEDVSKLENETPAEFMEVRSTLPIVLLHRNGSKVFRTLIKKLSSAESAGMEQKMLFRELRASLEQQGCLRQCRVEVDVHIKSGVEFLNVLDDSTSKACLVQMANQLRLK